MSSAVENNKFPIKITNFINPHLFHFQLNNIIGQTDIDDKLAKYVSEIRWSHPSGYQAKELEMVTAYIVEWQKWVRAKIDVILDLDSISGKQYIIWCLDHGIPMKLGAEHILPMSPELQELPPSAYLGGLAKCIPIEKRLDYAKGEYIIENTDRFTEFLTAYAKRLLEEASEIYFKPLQKMDDNHIFGDIQIVKHNGSKVNMLRELVKRHNGGVQIDDNNDIPFGIENWETTKTPRFKTDSGQLNVREVTYTAKTNSKQNKHHQSAISVCSNDLDDDDKMVLEWSRQNVTLARDMERTMKEQFEAVITALDRYVMATRQRREPHQMFHNAGSMSSVNQSHSNLPSMYGSRCTLAESQSIGAQSIITSKVSKGFTERMQLAAKKSTPPTTTTTATTTNKKASKMVFIPAGFERDVLEFHKYNDF